MNTQTKNSLLLLLCSLIWGTAFVAQSAGSGMGAYSFLAGRSWLAVLVLIKIVVMSIGARKFRFTLSTFMVTEIPFSLITDSLSVRRMFKIGFSVY